MSKKFEKFFTQDRIYLIDKNNSLFIGEESDENPVKVNSETEVKMALKEGIRITKLISIIKKYLDDIDNLKGRANRIKGSNDLFDTLIKYKPFVDSQKKFKDNLQCKLLELVMYQDYEEGYEFLDQLFPNMDYHNVFFEEQD
jgi:hypothetical protein